MDYQMPNYQAMAGQATLSNNKPSGTPIEQSTQRLEAITEQINTDLDSLCRRLEPYLSKDPETKPSNPTAPYSGSSSYTMQLTNLCSRLHSIDQVVCSIMERLEV